MGGGITESNGKSDGEVKQSDSRTGTGTGNSGTSTSTPDTRGNGNDTGNGTGTGNTTGTGTGTGETKEEKLPVMVTVTEEQTEEEKRLERNRKRRERYQAEKIANGQTVKPRKVNKTKNNNSVPATNMTKEQMNNLIVSTSMVIASRPNCQHWQITEKEADSITTPLLAMIAESEKLEVITKNSNQIALIIACITIFLPRLFITVNQTKTQKKEKKPNVKPEQIRTAETGNKKSDIVNGGKSASPDTVNDYVLSWDD